jgi:sugar lactone lactonase YvrE
MTAFSIVDRRAALTGESPLWDPGRGVLWWIDIQGQRLLGHRDPDAYEIALPSQPGFVAPLDDGRLVLGLEDGLWALDPDAGAPEHLGNPIAGQYGLRLNDAKADRQGRLWFGAMEKHGSGAPVGFLFCRATDGRFRRVRDAVRIPNAVAVSRDGSTLYFCDSPTREILAFPLDQATGDLGTPAVLARLPAGETPDGAIVDASDTLWVAIVGPGRIDGFRPDGTTAGSFALPVSRPTMPAVGGADGRTLFVTSQRRFLDFQALAEQPAAGRLIATDVAIRGWPACPMRLSP